jgi:hypothetical protein
VVRKSSSAARSETEARRHWADAFALTFAQPVAGRQQYYDRTMEDDAMRRRARPGRAITWYDPLEGA